MHVYKNKSARPKPHKSMEVTQKARVNIRWKDDIDLAIWGREEYVRPLRGFGAIGSRRGRYWSE